MEPPGSSIPRYKSIHSTDNVTSAPATKPVSAATAGGMKTQPALLATSPPTQPLAHSEASGRPKRARVISAAVRVARPADSVVLTAIRTTAPGAAPANNMAPDEFKPNHPISARKQESNTKTVWCP